MFYRTKPAAVCIHASATARALLCLFACLFVNLLQGLESRHRDIRLTTITLGIEHKITSTLSQLCTCHHVAQLWIWVWD